jgi:hypothetical protein
VNVSFKNARSASQSAASLHRRNVAASATDCSTEGINFNWTVTVIGSSIEHYAQKSN